jgi:hypothetical protein
VTRDRLWARPDGDQQAADDADAGTSQSAAKVDGVGNRESVVKSTLWVYESAYGNAARPLMALPPAAPTNAPTQTLTHSRMPAMPPF